MTTAVKGDINPQNFFTNYVEVDFYEHKTCLCLLRHRFVNFFFNFWIIFFDKLSNSRRQPYCTPPSKDMTSKIHLYPNRKSQLPHSTLSIQMKIIALREWKKFSKWTKKLLNYARISVIWMHESPWCRKRKGETHFCDFRRKKEPRATRTLAEVVILSLSKYGNSFLMSKMHKKWNIIAFIELFYFYQIITFTMIL